MPTRKTTKKPKPTSVEEEIDDLEIVDDEDETDEIDEVPAKKSKAKKVIAGDDEDDEDEDTDGDSPAAKKSRKPQIEFGSAWLVAHINEVCDTKYRPYDLRVLLRKMAKTGEFEREVGEDRSRYEFKGPKDPVVKAIIKKVQGGAIKEAKQESLDKLKISQAAKKKAKKAAGASGAKAKGKTSKRPKPADDDVEDLD